MAKNLEIKARLRDITAAHAVAARLSGGGPQLIKQHDVFFHCARGRLKLRHFADGQGELIHYHRPDTRDARLSDYVLVPTASAELLGDALRRALDVSGTVEKTRWLYWVGQTRVHLDEVLALGTFLELEVVLRPGQSEDEARQIAEEIMREFGIAPADLIACAYIDLLRQQQS
jgi:predicted adenylyl cyclase CyaB